jgi:beta-phosphoglucomutase-like phosphatase (HAD superfamily)
MERLIFFDIDGTLTRTQNGFIPFNQAIMDTFNVGADIRSVFPDGMTDPHKTVSRAKSAKHALSNVEGDAKVTGRGPSSRADARDLRKISPFGRNDKGSFFASLACLAR